MYAVAPVSRRNIALDARARPAHGQPMTLNCRICGRTIIS
jgi:hypothetical protein